jgi:hypothetical protein
MTTSTPESFQRCRKTSEDGMALVLVLLFVLGMSAVGASMVVLSQTESFASVNYRMMSQARYGAESGVHRAINYLLNTYTLPGDAGDPLANFDMTVSPVTYLGQPVVLSSIATVAANYPSAAASAAFTAAVQGSLATGGTSVQYAASATLVSMRQIQTYGAGATTVVQTWRIDGTGTANGVKNASVEVSALLEQQVVATHTYAAFATKATCGALSFSGGVVTNSYDSTSMTFTNGKPNTDNNTGDVGTNGNLTESGGSIVHGSLSTPRQGVGNCKSGAVDALTQNGSGTLVTDGLVKLPQAVAYPLPDAPTPTPPTTNMSMTSTTNCAGAGFPAGTCAGTAGVLTLTPTTGAVQLGNVKLSGGATLKLNAGTYNINSLSLSGNSNLIIQSGPVILNVQGAGGGTVVDLTGGTVANGSFLATDFQIKYGGTGSIKLAGGASSSTLVYAPAASLDLSGGADFYGSLLGASVTVSGGTKIHYDRHLSQTFFTVGNHMLNTFTWKKY